MRSRDLYDILQNVVSNIQVYLKVDRRNRIRWVQALVSVVHEMTQLAAEANKQQKDTSEAALAHNRAIATDTAAFLRTHAPSLLDDYLKAMRKEEVLPSEKGGSTTHRGGAGESITGAEEEVPTLADISSPPLPGSDCGASSGGLYRLGWSAY